MLLDSLLCYLDSHDPRTRAKRHRRRPVCTGGLTPRRSPRLLLEVLEKRALPSFLAPLSFDVGTTPESVAVGDFNNDGRPDLATANRSSNNVSVLVGNGGGTFQAPRHFPAGETAISLAVADFDRDSRPDLAVAIGGPTGRVSVLLGNGDGSFQAPRTFAAGQIPTSVVVGDFNRDTRPDLAVASYSAVHVLLGNGDGSFQAARPFDAGQYHFAVAVGDFNADTIADLATGARECDEYKCSCSSVRVLSGNGDGTFQAARAAAVSFQPISVAVGDFNSDTHLDVTMVDERGGGFVAGTVNVLLGRGDGTLGPPRAFDVGVFPKSEAIGEFNSDNRPDLAVANSGTGNVSVLLGRGDGTFQAARHFPAGGAPHAVAAADVNGDGRTDVAVADRSSNNVGVLLGNGDGTLQAVPSVPAGSYSSVAAADVNGDGRPDLAVVSHNCSSIAPCLEGFGGILLGNGDGTFQAARSFAAGAGPRAVAVADFNRDGRPDLAVAGYGVECDKGGCGPTESSVRVLLGNGDGSFQAPRTFDVVGQPESVAVGHFNGDGFVDVAVANGGNVRVLLGNGDGTLQPPRPFAAGVSPYSVAVGDFNGDGRPDLVTASVILLGNGDGTFQPARPHGGSGGRVAVGDLNGDARPDLVVTGSPVRVLLGNGDGTFQPPRGVPGAGGSVAFADFNGDGQQDLAIGSGTIRVLLGNGDGTFQATHISCIAGANPQSVATSDLNGDGWPDLAVAGTGSVSILLNAADDAAFFYLDTPTSVPAGQPFDLTVYVLSGDWQRLAHGYRGTVAFWSTDAAATLPEPYTFRPTDYGIASFPGGVTLRTPGTQYLAAFDVATFTIIGYAVVDVLGRGGSPGGGGAPFGAADFALAQAGLDLVTWTRPRKVVPIAAGTVSSVRG